MTTADKLLSRELNYSFARSSHLCAIRSTPRLSVEEREKDGAKEADVSN